MFGDPITVKTQEKIPVILDTDIGDDIDDTWALGMLLQRPELDIKLILGDHGKNIYRTKLIAKFLQQVGRTHIPIGIGLDKNLTGEGRQSQWVENFDLNAYPGKIYPDGIRALIDIIMKSPQPITIIAIGPVPNIARALQIEPRIATKAKFVGMHGSIKKGYGGSLKPSPEYNVREDIEAFRMVLRAPWSITITPLDTCGIVYLEGDLYKTIQNSNNVVAKAIMENYKIWCANPIEYERRSSILFDTVAIWLAFSEKYLQIENIRINVTDEGFTKVDPAGREVRAALEWTNLDAFKKELVECISSINYGIPR